MDRLQTSVKWAAPAQRLAEIALVFAVFFVQGAWPTPEVNEPNYLGKAIHFWNPAWGANDFFLGTADTHWVFYFTFGWLSRWLGPTALAWVGRTLTWVLLAWAWRRLSFAVRAAALAGAGHGRAVGGNDPTRQPGRRMDHRRRRGQGLRLRPGVPGLGGVGARPLEPRVAAAGGRGRVSRPRRRLGCAGDRHRLGPLAMGRTFALQNGQPRRGRRPPASLAVAGPGGRTDPLPARPGPAAAVECGRRCGHGPSRKHDLRLRAVAASPRSPGSSRWNNWFLLRPFASFGSSWGSSSPTAWPCGESAVLRSPA